MFFCLFAGYFMLRPVRETMGITAGVDRLQWLFTGTFVATLAATPLFGWLAARVERRRILFWSFLFFAANLLAFAAGFAADPDNVALARTFYVWISVFVLIAVSIAWSVLVDVFPVRQAKRLFALMATGASVGGLAGPVLGALLVASIGHVGLLLLTTGLLLASTAAARACFAWRARHPSADDAAPQRDRPLGGNPFAGATAVFRSPFLLGIASFVVLLATANTFLYFEQARLVEAAFPVREEQTRFFSTIDAVVQSLTILCQLFLTGRIAQRFGIGVLLTAVPLVTAAGYFALALAPVLGVLVVVFVLRRLGEYAFIRPGREMLFTLVDPEAKYKAKNFVDAVAYRGGDAVSGWAKAGIDAVSTSPAVAMLAGCALSLLWAANGWWLARRPTGS
jgi:AAA family ATP:ADP antiporter